MGIILWLSGGAPISNIEVEDATEWFIEDTADTIVRQFGEFKLKHLDITGCEPMFLNMLFGNWSKPLPKSFHIHPDINPPMNEEALVFTSSLLNILVNILRSFVAFTYPNSPSTIQTNHAQVLESLTLSGTVEWLSALGAVMILEPRFGIPPSLLHLSLRVTPWAEDPVAPFQGQTDYGAWGLGLLAERSRSSSESPRLESLTISEWIVTGYEDHIREHVGELILLPST